MNLLPPLNLFWILADLLQIMVWLIIAEVIVSWLIMFGTVKPYQPWVRTLQRLTDPVLDPFRRLLPPYKLGGLDISPLLAIIVLQVIENFLFKMGAASMR